MIAKLDQLGTEALNQIKQCGSLESLEQARLHFLGKKGALSEVLRGLGSTSPEERPRIGAAANQWRDRIEAAMSERKSILEEAALSATLESESLDVTLPARVPHLGALHPVTLMTRRLVGIFSRLGFDVATGPEVESDFYNFEAVNIPKDHPARDMQDTFFLNPGVVLRTHTSAVQMRTMKERPWPLRILCPGAVYRCDHDATHLPMFHQIEGLWVDRNVKMSDLKGVLAFFARELFGSEAKVRFRPSYFPFVEPGAEVDLSCFRCIKKPDAHCRICKGTGWVEVLGAGMVHPRLFETAGYATQEVTGFAFGLGIERIAMLYYQIPDLRLMVSGDSRFLKQFA